LTSLCAAGSFGEPSFFRLLRDSARGIGPTRATVLGKEEGQERIVRRTCPEEEITSGRSARGGFGDPPRAASREQAPPVGPFEHTSQRRVSTRGRRPRWRPCLRKGCPNRFQAQHWNQRYCREPDCRRELRRWQAAKRQRKRRATSEGRTKHAQAERQRRQRKKRLASSLRKAPARPRNSARGHANGPGGKKFLPGRSAIGPVAMSLVRRLRVSRHPTAATSAPPPCDACTIANASGGSAIRKMDV